MKSPPTEPRASSAADPTAPPAAPSSPASETTGSGKSLRPHAAWWALLVAPCAFGLALLLGLFASFLYERSAGEQLVLRGISFEEQALSGLDEDGIASLLTPLARSVNDSPVVLIDGEQQLETTMGNLGIELETARMSAEALRLGRDGSGLSQFFFWLARLGAPIELQRRYSGSDDRALEAVSSWFEANHPPPSPPQLVGKKRLQLQAGKAGARLQASVLKGRLLDALTRRSEAPPQGQLALELELPWKEIPPTFSDSEVKREQGRLHALQSSSLLVQIADTESEKRLWIRDLRSAVELTQDPEKKTLKVQLSGSRIRRSLKPLLDEVERPAVDTHFEFSRSGSPRLTESETGRRVETSELLAAIWKATRSQERVAKVSLKQTTPALTQEEAKGFQGLQLVSSFTTKHSCCQARVKNIHHAAAQLNHTLLRPGERFSLNELLGPRSEASGYQSAPTIVHGRMKKVYGGGISQLATTLFNAALRGGYEIVQRQPHSIYFPRYPEGHEATVSFPEPDLIFRNDTETPLIIQTQYSGTFIRVLFYGNSGGRTISVDRSKRYKTVEIPTDYEADEEMDPEESRRLRAGQPGWTVLVSRTVTEADGTEKVEKREVVYNPRPELVRVHPCVIPEGKDGHTGEECPEPEEEEEDCGDEPCPRECEDGVEDCVFGEDNASEESDSSDAPSD